MRCSICPVPDDDPITPIAGCLGVVLIIVLVVNFGLWTCLQIWPPQNMQTVPAAECSNTPLYNEHKAKCPQCSAPLMDHNGNPTGGFCEEGFRLMQEDVNIMGKTQ